MSMTPKETNIRVAGDVMLMKPWELPFDALDDAVELLWCADFAASHDRAARGFRSPDTVFECSEDGCHAEPVAIGFYDYDHGGYPRNRWRLSARLICWDHGGEWGYFAHLGGGVTGGMTWADDWFDHLSGKTWFHPSFRAELECAERFWQERAAKIIAREKRGARAERNAVARRELIIPQNPRSISVALRTFILERDNFRCRRCGNEPKHVRLVIDHIVPVAKGGTADPTNLQTLCEPCNASKSDRDPHPHDLTATERSDG